jgi:hypothetical protein
MITPAGTECRFYYEDFNRGRQVQECRLIAQNPGSAPWHRRLCHTCPVPRVLRANACPNMVLEGRVARRWLLIRQVMVRAHCTLTRQQVEDPFVGCGHCHEARWRDTVNGSRAEPGM